MMLSYTITEILMLVIGTIILGALIDRMYIKYKASKVKEINTHKKVHFIKAD